MRPNIRVEIQNNLAEPMEVDENEEGEISDGENKQGEESVEFNNEEMSEKRDQEKLQERARRFQLNPEEIKNFTEEDLQLLYNTLGINQSNQLNVRFEVIHMRGIKLMSAGDILDYFMEYAPNSIEWIDEESCNIVWTDKKFATRALHFMSRPVRGMPVRDDCSYFDNLEENDEDTEADQSILVINKNREIKLQEDIAETFSGNNKTNWKNSVDISEITTTIPPGYWRLGNPHKKAKSILMRFSLKTDKQPYKNENFNRYYKNPQKRQEGIFGRNKDMHTQMKTGNQNPWSTLAKNWDGDSQFREREPLNVVDEPKVEIKNQNLRERLGSKRKEDDMKEGEMSEEKPKKIKIPRMRMYADEEEEKIKRKKMLHKINNQIKKIDQDTATNSDLRTMLNMTNRTQGVKLEQNTEPEVFDLGRTLKNRNKKMVFEIKHEVKGSYHKENHRNEYERDIELSRHRRKYSNSDEDDFNYSHDKPKSKVAVVIKKQKTPAVASAVASTVWSRVSLKSNHSESGSESEHSEKSVSGEEEEAAALARRKVTSRPGFSEKFAKKDHKSPLKIEINNDHFKNTT